MRVKDLLAYTKSANMEEEPSGEIDAETVIYLFFFKQKTAYEIGLGIPAEPLFRSRINIIGSREGSRNRRRLKANQTGKKFRVGIKSNISTNRNNLISGVDRCIHLNAMKKTTI